MQQRATDQPRLKRQALCRTLILTAPLSVALVNVAAADELKPFEASYA